MRTDYFYEISVPDDQVKAWLKETLDVGAVLDLKHLRETRDAPSFVLRFADARHTAYEDWLAGAKDRPFTREPNRQRFRLFDGRWMYTSLNQLNVIPTVVEANKLEMVDAETGEETWCRYTGLTWDLYQQLVEAEDEEGCRKMATAMYEWFDRRGAADLMLVEASNELQKRLPDK